MTTNLADVNCHKINTIVDTVHKVVDIITSKSDGESISIIKDINKLKEFNTSVDDILESKLKQLVQNAK